MYLSNTICFVSFIHARHPPSRVPHPSLHSPVDSLAAVHMTLGVSMYHKNPLSGEGVVPKTVNTKASPTLSFRLLIFVEIVVQVGLQASI